MDEKIIKKLTATTLIVLTLLNNFFILVPTAEAATGVPSIISYQGRLADSNGDLLGGSGTAYYFKFSIWDNSTVGSGSRLWPSSAPSSFSTTVRQGVFNVNIGDTAGGFPDTLDYDFNTASDVYLQVEVSSDNSSFQTLSPRQRIGAAPFARLAGAVSGSTTPSSFGTTTPFGTSVVSIAATSTNSTGLSIRAIGSQSANLFQIQNSTGSNLLYIDSVGALFANQGLNVSGLAALDRASSTIFSSLDGLYVGRSATTTIRGESNATSTFAGGVYANGLQINGFATTSLLRVSLGFFQDGLSDCSDETQTILYNATTGKFSCGADSGAGGGGISTIEENNASVVGSALSIDFLGSDFDVTANGTEGDIAIDYTNSGITRRNQNETLSSLWNFQGGASTTRQSVFYNAYFGATATSTFDSTGLLTLASGLVSQASSTFSSDLRLSALSQGFSYIGSTGKVNSIASSSINLSASNSAASLFACAWRTII
jgi:hypothetical protein